MKYLVLFLTVINLSWASAETTMKMNYNQEDLLKVIEAYSKVSGQKFVVDASVRGKVSIFTQKELPLAEAFNELTSALAVNGYGISKQGDTMIVKSARNIQRDYIEVSSERPSLKPERMYSWVYSVRNQSASQINRDVRTLMSRDGEMVVNTALNQLIFTDWVSNLNRIADLLKEIDKPADPAVAKFVKVSTEPGHKRKKMDSPKEFEKKETE